MTNEQAVEIIKGILQWEYWQNDTLEAFILAIKALETGEIYITGEDYNLYMEGYKAGKKDFQPKQGKWIISEYVDTRRGFVTKCPFCKTDTIGGGNFCPNCGASMMKGGAE